jgi:MFS transporter, YNFM family, putative membrane transport protein
VSTLASPHPLRFRANIDVSSPSQTVAAASYKTPIRSILLLAVAGFASQAQVRVTDSLLPQIASDFHTTVGSAAVVVTAYAVAHGSVQLVIGPVGDKLGKYRTVAMMCAIAIVMVTLCGLATSLHQLMLARFATGLVGGWIIPISMAYVGDVTPYERRQPILGRYLTGQILGQLSGQAAGGVLGDLLGWRNVFFVLAGVFALATAGLVFELITNPATRKPSHPNETTRGFVADYAAVLSGAFARIIILVAFIENVLVWGAFAYIGAFLRLRFGLSFTLIGLSVGCFGIGGLIYAGLVKFFVLRLGQVRLAIAGGFVIALGYIVLCLAPVWWFAPLGTVAIGLGFYMLHNTLQTNATQMTPQARGTAVAIFSSAIFIGQTAGVAIGSLLIDRFGAVLLFLISAALLPMLSIWFGRILALRAKAP